MVDPTGVLFGTAIGGIVAWTAKKDDKGIPLLEKVKTGKPLFYKTITLNMATARADQVFNEVADYIIIKNQYASVPCYIRLNEPNFEKLDLRKYAKFQGTIWRFYITNEVGTGSVDLLLCRGLAFVTEDVVTETVVPSMPVIGERQVAWFQSELKEVAADGGSEDLISYVVPDGMKLHICSGVVSCAFPRLQRYKLVTTPAATYISPTSHIDPDALWINEEEAYDGDTATFASSYIPKEQWGSYLILLVNPASIDKVRFYAYYDAAIITSVDIDIYYGGAWHDVYEGAYADKEWIEKDIPAGAQLVSKARIRFYNSALYTVYQALYEFQFNTAEETAQEGIYFDTHAIIPYLPQAPYIVPAGATFAVRVYNDDDAAHNMSVSLAGFLQRVEG